MKVLYLALESPHSPGVKKKISSMVQHLNATGIETQGLYFSTEILPDEKSNHPLIEWVHCKKTELPGIFNRRFIWRFQGFYVERHFYSQLKKHIRNNYDPDYIILRYPSANAGLLGFTKAFRKKVILEHNTKEMYELANFGKFLFHYHYRSEKYLGPMVIRSARAIIGVTPEIVDYEKNRARRNVNSAFISNGFDTGSTSLRTIPAFDGKSLNMMILVGSGVSDWYGIDRIIKSMHAYKGDLNITLYVIGKKFDESLKLTQSLNLEDKVIFTGYLEGKELDALFDKCHIAFSAMALFRKNLKYAATLKVKEYLSRGIPFILGYIETDLEESAETRNFYISFPNDESLIDMEDIRKFVSVCQADTALGIKMRKFAVDHLDYKVKALQLKNFLLSLERSGSAADKTIF